MKRNKILLHKLFFLAFCVFFNFQLIEAQDSLQIKTEPAFKLTPSGRVLIEGALYASPEKELFPDGATISEARVGVKMNYGKWTSWIDVGFAYAKIGLRNMWIQYDFNEKNSLRAGNFIQQYGLQSTTSSQKSTFEAPLASNPFTPGLQLGVKYKYKIPCFYAATALTVESNALTQIMNYPLFNQQGYGILTRLVWRKPDSGKPGSLIAQAGVSGGFLTPQRNLEGDYDLHDGFVLSSIFPTRVTQNKAVEAVVEKSKNLFKFTPEIVLAYQRLALESQYFFQQINRRNGLNGYISQGGYVTLRGVLIGDHYGYDATNAQLVNPKKNALECVVDYNYLTLSDHKAGIFGGRANSFNLTLNYYFNPYFTARLNYSFTHTWDRKEFQPVTVNIFQIRLMALF